MKSVKSYISTYSVIFFVIIVLPLSSFLLYHSWLMLLESEYLAALMLLVFGFGLSGMIIRQYWVIYKYPVKCMTEENNLKIRGMRSSKYRTIKFEEIISLTTFPNLLIIHLNNGETIELSSLEVRRDDLSSLYIYLSDLLESKGFIDEDRKKAIEIKSYKRFLFFGTAFMTFMIYSIYSSGALESKNGVTRTIIFIVFMILLLGFTYHIKTKHERSLKQKRKKNDVS